MTKVTISDATMRRLNTRMRTKYRGGLYITGIRPGSPADAQQIMPGDVLLGIHGWQTASMKDLAGILEHPDIQRGPREVRSDRLVRVDDEAGRAPCAREIAGPARELITKRGCRG